MKDNRETYNIKDVAEFFMEQAPPATIYKKKQKCLFVKEPYNRPK